MENYCTEVGKEVVIFDLETTGLSTDFDRIIEVGASIVKDDEIVSYFITGLTGISATMLQGQPSPKEVMSRFYDYIGDRPLLAHNASFDIRFLNAEMYRIGKCVNNPLLCTMLLSRRLIPEVQNHKLGTLMRYIDFNVTPGHQEHRALDDVKATVFLWIYLKKLVKKMTGNTLNFDVIQELSRTSKNKIQSRLKMLSKQRGAL